MAGLRGRPQDLPVHAGAVAATALVVAVLSPWARRCTGRALDVPVGRGPARHAADPDHAGRPVPRGAGAARWLIDGEFRVAPDGSALRVELADAALQALR